MKATIMEPTSTNAEFSVAHSRREKDSPPFSVNLSISGLIKEDFGSTIKCAASPACHNPGTSMPGAHGKEGGPTRGLHISETFNNPAVTGMPPA